MLYVLKYLTFIIAFSIMALTRCQQSFFDKRVNEGVIEYEVQYPTIEEDNIIKAFLPKAMTFTFKDNVFCTQLSSSFNQFEVGFISNSNNHALQQTFKLIPKKLYSDIEQTTIDSINQLEYGTVRVSYHEETKEIAGLTCKKAMVFCTDSNRTDSFAVYYTEDIRFEDPNWTLPFKEIKGVPLEYQINQMGIVMKFSAKSVKTSPVESTFFEQTLNDFKKVPFKVIDQDLKSLASDLSEFGLK